MVFNGFPSWFPIDYIIADMDHHVDWPCHARSCSNQQLGVKSVDHGFMDSTAETATQRPNKTCFQTLYELGKL